MDKADEVYIRVIEQCPWLLETPILLDILKPIVVAAYCLGSADGASEMKNDMERILIRLEARQCKKD